MLIAHMYALVLDCTRMCENGGTLDMENCTCNCTGGFSGDNCEREYIVWRLAPIDVVTTCNTYSIASVHWCLYYLNCQDTEHRRCKTLINRSMRTSGTTVGLPAMHCVPNS